jgi:hypothetical protein
MLQDIIGRRTALNYWYSVLLLWAQCNWRSATGAVQLAQCNWRSATEGAVFVLYLGNN